MKRGCFITLEGIEGVGKSTHLDFIAETLRGSGHDVVLTREPGGTPAGEVIRELLLGNGNSALVPKAELLLIFAARAQHLEQVIVPALAGNRTVICDRFTDASYAYQGAGRGIHRDEIRILEEFVQKGLKPDLTLLFDAPAETGLQRVNRRGAADRFEAETVAFFRNVRQAYLALAAGEPDRIKIIDAGRPIEEVREAVATILDNAE